MLSHYPLAHPSKRTHGWVSATGGRVKLAHGRTWTDLSSEEHSPSKLVEIAVAAEEAGFDFVSISDDFHPWINEQGHSPFVWSVLGALSQATSELEVGVGVTCPTVRIHPAISAHAAATAAMLLEDRFTWGVGTSKALNEHVLGDAWPPADIRLEMLEEAVEIIRGLWKGESFTHRGRHYTVEDARIFDIPEELPPIVISAFGDDAVGAGGTHRRWALDHRSRGRSDREVCATKEGRARCGASFPSCWDPDLEKAVDRAYRVWPNTALTRSAWRKTCERLITWNRPFRWWTAPTSKRHSRVGRRQAPSSSRSRRQQRWGSTIYISTRSAIPSMGSWTSGETRHAPRSKGSDEPLDLAALD